ncbi:MAG: methyltransferase domain-containing protein [Candidatus Marinimicrobia bacterium]|nr:methyltransferase domain-containing protein [Candidatus Neomarinimicrobiota bacterium]
MQQEVKKLNLGCGAYKKEGYTNIDISPERKPEIVHDLNNFPYPFFDNTFELIEADHVLEHLKDVFSAMKEIHRISKTGAKIIIHVPHFSRGFSHPDHKRGFDFTFPYYFNPSFNEGYQGFEFKLKKIKFNWFAQPYLKKNVLSKPIYYIAFCFGKIVNFLANLSPIICSKIWCFWVGGFEEIEFIFEAKK